MSNRRKFIAQTGFAATALMMAKPFNAIAKFTSPLGSTGYTYNHITFLHTLGTNSETVTQVKKIATKNSSIVLVHADNAKKNITGLSYDVSPSCLNDNSDGYKIIYKDNIKIGVIDASPGEKEISHVNQLAAHLKQERNCHLVVCISALGFKNKNGLDDRTLAAKSENLDMIVGRYGESSIKRPFIALNKNKAEVIIHHTADSDAALGKIKIGFNQAGIKHAVSF